MWTRRAIVAGCLVGGAYLWSRFDSFVLATPCSPVARVAPGTRLWVDRRPPRYHPGDLVFFLGPDGHIHLAEVTELQDGDARLWVETDDPRCPGLDSRQLGWLPRERLQGRVVFASGR
jgi:hypothetical protein